MFPALITGQALRRSRSGQPAPLEAVKELLSGIADAARNVSAITNVEMSLEHAIGALL